MTPSENRTHERVSQRADGKARSGARASGANPGPEERVRERAAAADARIPARWQWFREAADPRAIEAAENEFVGKREPCGGHG